MEPDCAADCAEKNGRETAGRRPDHGRSVGGLWSQNSKLFYAKSFISLESSTVPGCTRWHSLLPLTAHVAELEQLAAEGTGEGTSSDLLSAPSRSHMPALGMPQTCLDITK